MEEVAADTSAGAEGISVGAADISAGAEGISAEVEGILEALEGVISAVATTLAVGTSAVVGLVAEAAASPMGAASSVVAGLGADSSEAVASPMGADSSEAVASPMGADSLVVEAASIEMRSAIKAGGIALPEPEALVELGVMTGAVVGAVGADGRGQCFGLISSATSSRSRSGPIITIRSGRMVPGLTLIIAITRLTTGTPDWGTYTAIYMEMARAPMVTDTETIDAIPTLAAAPPRPIQMRSKPT
jgi:hypothetical protein